ncbi:RagB/SusD family nutrient uptake outer membrane protein [Mucilaginibacter sp. HMF5004]|uniref:RagB/SusD family nutrient uptake outer membrane protein n=1 Tax=Mucilaginibacter rivuli TaxID=2857527 RepID=UPI001C5D7D5D|nr:RagB/SusD family nutrient uptake outer membrane protein [Mucilaginibacter rivuli]MBW4889954.1 RagB/SusD family nutrient uptake outer membrane protein [Mucilaginibacter rivuli]
MINNIKYKFLLLVVILTAGITSSCNKYLDVKPQDGLVRQDYWKTKEQLDASVAGCYASLIIPTTKKTIPLAKYLFAWGELRADMVQPTNDPTASGQSSSGLSTIQRDELDMLHDDLVSTNSLANWEAIYRTINYCNLVIKYGPDVIKNDNTLTQPTLNAYLAEARTLRALMYFYLLRTFGEVPLKTDATASDTDLKPIAKSSQQAVYNQIIEDLKFGTQNAVPSYGNMADDKGRITKYTAYTILADAYLWMEDYQNAIDACDVVIQSNMYQLLPQGILQGDFFNNVYTNGNSVEGIFEFQYNLQALNPFFAMFANPSHEFNAADWVVAGNLFGIDINDSSNKDVRGSGTSFLESNSNINKFTAGKSVTTSYTHWFVYRYADVLLMKAEALAWVKPGDVNNGTVATNLVKQLRNSRHAFASVNNVTIADPDFTSALSVSTYVFNERAREFAFEGKRWYDILRNAKRNNYANENILLDIVASSALPSKQQSVINKYRDHRSHYLPIFSYEIQTNKLLVQNSFYQ